MSTPKDAPYKLQQQRGWIQRRSRMLYDPAQHVVNSKMQPAKRVSNGYVEQPPTHKG